MKNDRIIVEVRLDNQQNQLMDFYLRSADGKSYLLSKPSAWAFGSISKTVAPSRRLWPFGLGIRTRGWTRPS